MDKLKGRFAQLLDRICHAKLVEALCDLPVGQDRKAVLRHDSNNLFLIIYAVDGRLVRVFQAERFNARLAVINSQGE